MIINAAALQYYNNNAGLKKWTSGELWIKSIKRKVSVNK